MSGHPLHHHHPSGQTYPYQPSASASVHPPAHMYHSSHRASLSASLPPSHPNGHSNSPHHPGPPPPPPPLASANSSAVRHGSAQVPPPPSPAVQQAHHHPVAQPHPLHHQPNLPPQQQSQPPHHASSHQIPPSANQQGAYGPSSHHPQPSQPPSNLHHPQSSSSHGHHHLNHSRDHQQAKDYHPHPSSTHPSHPSHPHPSHPSHPHSLPPSSSSSSSQRDQRPDPIHHRDRDHQPPRAHAQIISAVSEPPSLGRDQPQPPPPPPPLPRDSQHPQATQSVHAPLPLHPLPNSHPVVNSASHAIHPSNHHHHPHHHHHHHPSPAPTSRRHSPHSIAMVSHPNHTSSSAHVPPGNPQALPSHHHNGPSAPNGTSGAPGAHPLSGPSGPQPALPPALPNNTSGAGASSRQLAQPPPQASGTNGAPSTEDATVAAILRDGELNFQKQMGDWRPPTNPLIERLVKETELTWIAAGSASESLGDYDRALECYERALKHNPLSVPALTKAAGIYRHQENFKAAASYFSRLLKMHEGSGEIWGALGHCYLMIDELPRAYTSYQQALHHFPTPKSEPKLWYGIGILYDRYGSLEHAEEAFSSVIVMDPDFEKANEIYFRLGIIYKQQRKAALSLECFQYILNKPPSPLTEIDIWFQIGHVHEQQGNFDQAKEAYERVLMENPTHAKVLQQLGGLHCREGSSFYNPQEAVNILTRSLSVDANDSFSWYLLARVYMTLQDYTKAYESYQQAVYRDGKNPAFWCSIGVLYYAICQYHDSLDAYSRAIRINPYLSEVWFNLGALYESCNDQMPDAIDAYQRAIQLDSNNAHIQRRLEEIRLHKETGAPLGPPPSPRDMNHTSANWPFPNILSSSAEVGFGHSVAAHEETSRPPPVLRSSQSPVNTRPISPTVPSNRNNVHRPSTSSSTSGIRPQSAGPFAHGPPPPSLTQPSSHHSTSHPGHVLLPSSSAQQHVPPPATLNRRQSGGHGPLAPMEFEPAPRPGVRVASSTQHNLPHIRSVVDSQSRGPSPAPSAPEPLRRPMPVSASGAREIVSPRTSPVIRSNDRPQYPPNHNGGGPPRPPLHHGPPSHYSRYPPSAVPVEDTLPPQAQPLPVGGPLSRDRDRERPTRESHRLRPHSPDFRSTSSSTADRDARVPPSSTSSAIYPHRGSDYGGAGYPAPPPPQHQSPYDPRHASPGLRSAPPPPRFSPDQSSVPSPSWPATDYRSGGPSTGTTSVSPEDRRPGSQSGYPSQHYPPPSIPSHQMTSTQHPPPAPPAPPRRYDPRYDETTIPPSRHNYSHEQASPPRPRSALQRPYNEEADRQKTLATARQGQPSPTPSFAASEFSASANGPTAPRRTVRAKQANKEEEYSPASTNQSRRRKLPTTRSNTITNPPNPAVLANNPPVGTTAPPPPAMSPTPPVAQPPTAVREGSQAIREKKDKRKVANTKVRGSMKTKVNENSKRPSPSPAPPTNPSDIPLSRAQPTSPALPANSTMPDRRVDEEFEEYDEVADALLSFAGQPPRRTLTSQQTSPTDQSTHVAPASAANNRPTATGSVKVTTTTSTRSTRGSNGVSPGSDKSSSGGGGGVGVGVGGFGESRSPTSSSHSVAQRSTIDSPVRAGSSPESTLAQPYASQRFHQQHQSNNPTPHTAVGVLSIDSNPGNVPQPGPLSGGSQSTSALSPYPISFAKRTRADGSSPTAGEPGPEPKRSRSSLGHGSSRQPSPRSQANSDTRSPLSGNACNGKTNMMSLVSGKKGIINEVSKSDHGINEGMTNLRHKTKKTVGSSANLNKVEKEGRDVKSSENEEAGVDESRNGYMMDEEVDDEDDEGVVDEVVEDDEGLEDHDDDQRVGDDEEMLNG